MPPYPWLRDASVNLDQLPGRLRAMQTLGVPYSDEDIDAGIATARSQGELISADLARQDVKVDPESEMVALIAYLQRLGLGPQPVAPEEPLSQTGSE